MLDTNVVISGLIAPSSPPAVLIEAWLDHRFELVASSALLSELERIVERPRVRRYFADADTATSKLRSPVTHSTSSLATPISSLSARSRTSLS